MRTSEQAEGTVYRRPTHAGTWGVLLTLTGAPIFVGGAALAELWLGVPDSGSSPRQLASLGYTCIVVLLLMWLIPALLLRVGVKEVSLTDAGLLVRYHLRTGGRLLPRRSFRALTEDASGALPTWTLVTDCGSVTLDHRIDRVLELTAALATMVPEVELSWDPVPEGRFVAGAFAYAGPKATFRDRFPYETVLLALFVPPIWALWQELLLAVLRREWTKLAFAFGPVAFTCMIAGMLVSSWPFVKRGRRHSVEVWRHGIVETNEEGHTTTHHWRDVLFVGRVGGSGYLGEGCKVMSRQGQFQFYTYHRRDRKKLVLSLQRAAQANRGAATS